MTTSTKLLFQYLTSLHGPPTADNDGLLLIGIIVGQLLIVWDPGGDQCLLDKCGSLELWGDREMRPSFINHAVAVSGVHWLSVDISGECLQYQLESHETVQVGGIKWKNTILSQFNVDK